MKTNEKYWIKLLFFLIAYPFSANAANFNLDRNLGEFRLDSDSSIYEFCSKISMPCGVEDVSTDLKTHHVPVVIPGATPRKILDQIISRYSKKYHWVVRNGVINIEPDYPRNNMLLMREVGQINIHALSSSSAAGRIMVAAQIAYGTASTGNPRYAVVNLNLRHATVREALNEIARKDGSVIWRFRSFGDARARVAFSLSSWRTHGGMTLDDIRRLESQARQLP